MRVWSFWFVFVFQSACAAATEFTPAPEGTFTVAVIPDTQLYRGQHTLGDPDSEEELTNHIFYSITDWIVKHRHKQNIVFVSHVGDIVDQNIPEQWTVAQHCMDRLHGLIPYGVSVGNHDMTRDGDSTLFQRYFPESRFKDFQWYGGAFHPNRSGSAVSGNNSNSFQVFSAEGLDFIIFHLECNAPNNVLEWVNRELTKHSDRRAIVTTHMDLGPMLLPRTLDGYANDPKGRMQWNKCHNDRGNSATMMWDKCYKKHDNLFLICSGDQRMSQAMHVTEQGLLGNSVHSCLSDYSSDGSLRLYRFIPDENRVDVITYNVIRAELTQHTDIVDDEDEHQFSFDYPMRP